MTEILLAIASVFGVLAIHPFLTYPLSLWLVRRLHFIPLRPAASPGDRPSLALCFCAYREEHVIRDKIANLIALQERNPDLKVYVYVDGHADRTGEILSAHRDRFTVLWSEERTGKTVGMNRLVALAEADIIVFTDANVMLDPAAPERISAYFRDPEVGCVCGHLRYTKSGSVTGEVGSLYWRLEETIKQLESDTGSVMGADGSIFAIRRRLHQPPPPDIIDDMYVSFRILLDGHRVVRAPDALASEESVTSSKEEFRRKVRIACQAFNVHRLLWPELLRLDAWNLYKYVSHKLLRWLSIYNLVLAASLFTAVLLYDHLEWIALGLWLAGVSLITAGKVLEPRLLGSLSSMLEALAATGVGVWQSLRGNRFQTWTPASSNRQGPS